MKAQTFTIDKDGRRWVWNCGWVMVDGKGRRTQPNKKPLGHATFRKHFPALDLGNKAQREVLHGMDKPGRMWRRCLNRTHWVHSEYGACYLLATDGCHAVIELPNSSEHKHVCFENLSEPVTITLPPRYTESKTKKTKTKREAGELTPSASALLNKYLNLSK
jgi:hypothetical protein